MRLGAFDASGRRRPEPVEGSEFLLPADTVIAAIGQVPDVSFLPEAILVTSGNTIAVADARGTQTAVAGVFAGGDAVTGPATVIAAIAAGKKAAREIDAALREKNNEPPYQEPHAGRDCYPPGHCRGGARAAPGRHVRANGKDKDRLLCRGGAGVYRGAGRAGGSPLSPLRPAPRGLPQLHLSKGACPCLSRSLGHADLGLLAHLLGNGPGIAISSVCGS